MIFFKITTHNILGSFSLIFFLKTFSYPSHTGSEAEEAEAGGDASLPELRIVSAHDSTLCGVIQALRLRPFPFESEGWEQKMW